MQKGDLTQKNWVFGGPNMALANMGFKDQNWSHFGEERTVEREGQKKRRGRGRRKEIKQKGMETNLDYGFYEIM